jgi:hypothetical protein
MPAANHALPVPAFLINSIGLTQVIEGAGVSMSLIWKSPVGESGTPADDVRLSVGAVIDIGSPQKSEANTDKAGARPVLSPPASINPFPLTLILPLVLTVALSWLIVQIWPGGATPRTKFRLTVAEVQVGVVQPATDETGMTPIPPLKRKPGWSADAAADITKAPTVAAMQAFAGIPKRVMYFISPPYKDRILPRWVSATGIRLTCKLSVVKWAFL